MENNKKEEIKNVLSTVEFGAVASVEKGEIKVRAMHFAVDDDFNFYLATLKGDPKVKQFIENPTTSLLIIKGDKGFFEAQEIEVVGRAKLVGKEDREYAFNLLATRSPVVKNMMEGGALDMLAVIKVSPKSLKYRIVPEIIRGVGPAVIEFAEEKKEYSIFSMEGIKTKMARYFEELRAPFFTAAIAPVILGSMIAWARLGVFNPYYFILTLFGIVFLHAGTNVINDYFDHKRGNDEINTEFVRPFSGGSRMIQKELLKPKEVFFEAMLFFVLGSLIGLYLSYVCGPVVLILGIIGVLSGYFYSAPHFRFTDHGVGEFVVGINFGILVVLGSYFVQAGSLGLEPILAAIPLSLLIAGVLYINEFPDYTADKAVGKNNWVVRLGKEKAVNIYILIMLGVFASTLLMAVFKLISPFCLIIFFILPRVMRAIRVAKLNFNQTLFLIPANADTVMSHLFGGVLLSLAYILQRMFV